MPLSCVGWFFRKTSTPTSAMASTTAMEARIMTVAFFFIGVLLRGSRILARHDRDAALAVGHGAMAVPAITPECGRPCQHVLHPALVAADAIGLDDLLGVLAGADHHRRLAGAEYINVM